MKKTIIFHTNLGFDDVKRKISGCKDLARSLGLTIRFKYPCLLVGLYDFGGLTLYNQHLVKFSSHISTNGTGTTITGHYRYSYLLSFFWPFLFAIATYFMYVNSGTEYPLAPIITAIIGFVVTLFFTIVEPWYPFISDDRGQIVGFLRTLLEIK
jgi:hypothetical protein